MTCELLEEFFLSAGESVDRWGKGNKVFAFFHSYVELEDLKLVEKMWALLIAKIVGEGVEYHFAAIILQDAAYLGCILHWICTGKNFSAGQPCL